MFIIVLPIFSLSGCLNNGQVLSLSSVEWYTTTEIVGKLTFGNIHLDLSGSTTGDKVTVKTYGDGVTEEFELDLDQDKAFSQDVVIAFTAFADNIPRKYSTVVTAYSGNSTTTVNLESEELTYLLIMAE